MKPRHVIIDRNTGDVRIQARGGATYTLEELEQIERRAQRGDAAAAAILESLDATGTTPAEMLHDCPECRAAMAFGEAPDIMTPDEIAAMNQRTRTGRMKPVMRRRPYRRHR
jgi:hypothetical protein